MPAIAHRKNTELTGAADWDRDPIIAAALTIFRTLRKRIVGTARLVIWVAGAFAEARAQRAAIEAELYLKRYKHASKNDDDLPIAR